MTRSSIPSWLVVCLLALNGCSQQKAPEVRQYTIDQFMNTKQVGGGAISHDDRLILYFGNDTGIFNAYVVPAAGGPAKQVTQSKQESIFAYSFFPADNRFLYGSDRGGNEINHIYLQDEDGKATDLTPGEKERAGFRGWAHDGKSFFYTSNKRDPRFMDLYEMDAATLKPAMVYKNEKGLEVTAISPDKRYLALVKPITTSNTDMYLYEIPTKKLTQLNPHKEEVNLSPQMFSADSRSLYYLTDEGSEFQHLKRMDLETRQSVVDEQVNWDIMYAYLSHNGKYKVVGINNDARTEIRVKETATGKLVELPKMPDADIRGVHISRSEKLMTFYVNGARAPGNLYAYDFASGQVNKLTDSMNPEIRQEDLVESRVVRYKSFDGLEIPAVYYEPHQARQQKVPGLVWVHGGPGGQSRVGYSPLIQYLINHGYAVIAVNNRGSSGYGKTFFKMDDRKHGEGDLDDCVQAKKFLAGTGRVDPDKIGIIGGSYGGYMVLAALAFRPEAFAVGVDIFGVANWLRTLKNTPPWWGSFRAALFAELGDPDKDEEYLKKISPLFHASEIRRPLLVLQGANDARVLKVESDEMVAAVKKNNVPVEYIVFDDEGHGFVKKQNEIKGYRAIREFLDRYLK
jgi:dipeptidyl aminopeptidase/acylaminoacyl peptidase